MSRPVAPRVDWCHLLPPRRWPLPRAMLVGPADGLAEVLVRTGVVTEASVWPAPVDGWDLLVAGAGAPLAEVDRALAGLRPDGVCYVVRRRTVRRRQHLVAAARVCRAHGLREVGRWALLPDAERPRRYMPTGHPGAWTWYRNTLFRAPTVRTRMARALLRILEGWPTARLLLPPALALIAERDEAPPRQRGSAGLKHTAALTSGHDAGSRTILLPFAPGAKWPTQVMKIATEERLREATREEQQRLHDVRRMLPPALAAFVPRPEAFRADSARAVSTEATACGPTMLVDSARWPHDRRAAGTALVDIEQWLLGVHQATARESPQDLATAWLGEPLAQLTRLTSVEPAVVDLVGRAAAELRELQTGALVSVLQHYDVGPWNLVQTADGLRLVDWELDREAGRNGFGPPLVDLLYFSCSWYFLATGRTSRAAELDGLVEFFVRPGRSAWQWRLLEERLEHFRAAAGLPTSCTWALLVSCWLERALIAQLRWRRLGMRDRPDDTGLQYLHRLAMGADALVERWRDPRSAAPAASVARRGG
ncbi:MAG: hypothetical protein ACR2JO_02155 [Mycobacteriales bacterium]